MANAEQLALLKAGVEGWNKWRAEKPGEKIDLREADLRKAKLQRANLLRADLTEADLREANLSPAYLGGAYLQGADLRTANLSDAKLSEANLNGADLAEGDLNGAYLADASLMDANFSHAYLSGADLRRANLSRANLYGVNLNGANLSHANLNEANFTGGATLNEANLRGALLSRANLNGAHLGRANLGAADLSDATLRDAKLIEANLREANLSAADLSGAYLIHSNLSEANINNAIISKSDVYGVSVWGLKGEFKEQKDLNIAHPREPLITVDNIKVAQFVYLILNNREIRDVINTLTSKSVLILGRFAIPERKAILDALRDKLRQYDLLPIVFDFDRPTDKDFTETIKTLAGMCYFVIADVTNPKSSPLELQATVPDYQIPFVPIIQEGEYPFAMMVDLQKKYNWVLDTISYDSLETLLEILKPHIIDPAIRKRDELRLIKAKEPTIISGRELRVNKNRDLASEE